MNTELKYLLDVNFGDIDGLYDPNINKYFIDIKFKQSLLFDSKYFVIGRKGTGKSALYNWISRNQIKDGIMVSNKSFSDFPFGKLLQLSDENFAMPNQYQSIWKNIILTEYAYLLCKDESNPYDEDLTQLQLYLNHFFGENLDDLYKSVTRKTTKNSFGLTINGVGPQFSSEVNVDYRFEQNDLTVINERLLTTIQSFLMRNQTKPYIVQFDQLDDNYTSYVDNINYLQCMISLFKTIYQLNQTFRANDLNIKTIAYLRSDIYNKFYKFDPESARWDQYVLKLNWSIINRNDWFNSNLLRLINARITNSIPQLQTQSPFHTIFNASKIQFKFGGKIVNDIFKYIIHRTFQRPRDLIQFCIKIQDECRNSMKLNSVSINNAEKEYSLWLLGEVENEIAPIIKDTDSLYELLRSIGRGYYSVTDFKSRFSRFESKFNGIDSEEMLKVLYSFGIINNILIRNNKGVEQFSSIRNERSVFNRDLSIVTHPGFYRGLHVSQYLNRT